MSFKHTSIPMKASKFGIKTYGHKICELCLEQGTIKYTAYTGAGSDVKTTICNHDNLRSSKIVFVHGQLL
jgi:hypothetical protein